MKFEPKYKIEDYLGKTINYLTVLGLSDHNTKCESPQWEFRCTCGKVILAAPSRIISGHKKSCGCMRYSTPAQMNKHPAKRPPSRTNESDYIGKKNNRLTVVGVERPEGKGRLRLKCLCECGNITLIYPYQFSAGSIQSCGCARLGHSECHKGNTSRRTHGLSNNRFYKKWNDMIRRCYSPQEPAYKFYGELGITVCDEWRYSPEKFIAWCEATCPNADNFSIDRIDGSKGYYPDNCRWATQLQQAQNLKNNRFISIGDETHCVTEWCTLKNISPGAVYKRVKKGQTFETAISELIKLKSASVE